MSKRVALIAVTRGPKLLLGKRRDNGKWTLAGGHLEEGESPRDGARRELYEETGIRVERLVDLDERQLGSTTIHTFRAVAPADAKPTSENDPDDECLYWRWVDVSGGVPRDIAENAHGPQDCDKNVLLDLFGFQKSEAVYEAEDLAKTQSLGGGFPKLGIDNRRETPMVDRDASLEFKHAQLAHAVAPAMGTKRTPAKKKLALGRQHVAETMRTSGGAVHTTGPVGHSYVLANDLRCQFAPGRNPGPNSDLATKMHEDFHQVMKRVGQRYGNKARFALAHNMWLSLPDDVRAAVEKYVVPRNAHEKDSPFLHEEHLAVLHNYANDPRERQLFHDRFGHNDRSTIQWGVKRAIRWLNQAMPTVDETWLRPVGVQKSEDLAKMAIRDIPDPDPHPEGGYDYSHILPEATRAAGYRVRVHHWGSDSKGKHVRAEVTLPASERTFGYGKHRREGVVGYAEALIKPGKQVTIEDTQIEREGNHRGRGLGKALYEAMYHYALSKHGVKRSVGEDHSSSARGVHRALRREHGLAYRAKDLHPGADDEYANSDYNHRYGPYNYALKSEGDALVKGAMRRLAPIRADDRPSQKSLAAMHRWQGGGAKRTAREEVPRLEGPLRVRALHRLSGVTPTRVGANGEREFLLHRGMGEVEHQAATKEPGIVNHDVVSSWTPTHRVAADYANQYRRRPNQTPLLTSAWVRESAVRMIPNAVGDPVYGPGPNSRRGEYEVFVDPGHRSQVAELVKTELAKAEDDEVDRLLLHPDVAERRLALKLGNVHERHLERALRDPDPEVQRAALHHPALGHQALLALMHEPNQLPLQLRALYHPQVTRQHLEALYHAHAGSDDAMRRAVDQAIAGHWATDAPLAALLFADGRPDAVVEHHEAPPAGLAQLVEAHLAAPDDARQRALARRALRHPKLPPPAAEAALRRGQPEIQMAAAAGAHLPEALAQDILARGQLPTYDHEAPLRAAIIQHPEASKQHLETATRDRSPLVQVLARGRLQPFAKTEADRWLGQVLAKAVKPADYKGIVRAVGPEGAQLVDHGPDLTAHPPGHQPLVDAYREHVLAHPASVKRAAVGNRDEGISRKLIYKTPTGRYMVKPYHERPIRRTRTWTKHPHQGWAEMTNQALYHAAGIGHLHQAVHVAEHDMGYPHDREPALVVHMAEGYQPVEGMVNFNGIPKTQRQCEDIRKIALMDFLSNNLDRHGGNLMIKYNAMASTLHPKTNQVVHVTEIGPGGVAILPEDSGTPLESTPLAIDHSRSFQYVNTRDHQLTPRRKQPNQVADSFWPYVGTSAIDYVDPMWSRRGNEYDQQLDLLKRYSPTFEWWGEVGPNVRKAFHDRLGQIKDPAVRDHLRRNFDARADWLDERARFGLENFGTNWYNDEVPIYRPGETTDDEMEERARQEPIMKVESMVKNEDEDFFYHGTLTRNLDGIRERGIVPGEGSNGLVSVSNDPKVAARWASNRAGEWVNGQHVRHPHTILRLKRPAGMVPEWDPNLPYDPKATVLRGTIPPDHIEVLDGDIQQFWDGKPTTWKPLRHVDAPLADEG